MKINLATLPRPFFILAPMDDVTDTVFRRIVGECAPPDLYFTEFVNVDGLQSPGRNNLLKKLRFTAAEQPLFAQIWGLKPENFYQTAKELADGTFAQELGLPKGVNFAGIDINMGCPDKTVVKNGACSALINNRELAVEIIQAVKEGAGDKLPVSVKTRLGFSDIDFTWHSMLLKQKLNMLTIHGRTRKEMSKVPARWDEIASIRKLRDELSPETLIVGNGDVINRAHGERLAKAHGLDGIMIGRGIFQDPFVFAKVSPWEDWTAEQRVNLYAKQVKLHQNTWLAGERPLHTLNKFCKIYIHGFEGAKELREQLMAAQAPDELLAHLAQVPTTV